MIIEECNLTFDPDMLVNINSYREYHPKEHFSTLGPADYQCSKINLHGNRRFVIMERRLVKIMCEKKELRFSIFMLYSLADKWKMSPAKVYKILNSTGILDNYIIKCYDVLHTQGKEYLVEDITDFAREKGVNV